MIFHNSMCAIEHILKHVFGSHTLSPSQSKRVALSSPFNFLANILNAGLSFTVNVSMLIFGISDDKKDEYSQTLPLEEIFEPYKHYLE